MRHGESLQIEPHPALSFCDPEDWISPADAARLVGLPSHSIRNMMNLGHLTMRRLPGTHPCVSRRQLLDLLERSVKQGAG